MGQFDVDFLKENVNLNDYPVVVETGTCICTSTVKMAELFQEVYTVELNQDLYKSAVSKMSSYRNVTCLEGNSVEILPRLIEKIDKPCIFFP